MPLMMTSKEKARHAEIEERERRYVLGEQDAIDRKLGELTLEIEKLQAERERILRETTWPEVVPPIGRRTMVIATEPSYSPVATFSDDAMLPTASTTSYTTITTDSTSGYVRLIYPGKPYTTTVPKTPPPGVAHPTEVLNDRITAHTDAWEFAADDLVKGAFPEVSALSETHVELNFESGPIQVYASKGTLLPECPQCRGRARKMKYYINHCASCDLESPLPDA